MARINLLSWREEWREERRKRFLMALAGVLAVSVAAVLAADRYIGAVIDRQLARNNYLSQQIALLDEGVARVSELKSQRQQLIERMRIIQSLQGNRSISGRVFDQLARALPDGVYFSAVSMSDKTLSIAGVAESNNRVSDLMRNLDASDWFEAPNLIEVKALTAGAEGQGNVFQLTVVQTRPATLEDTQ